MPKYNMAMNAPRNVIFRWLFFAFALVIVFLYLYLRSSGVPNHSVKVPTEAPPNSLVVFNFSAEGHLDAKYYGIGFSKALSDLLFCAPTTVTLQPSGIEISEEFYLRRLDPTVSPTDRLAKDMGRRLGVRWAVVGNFHLDGNHVKVEIRLLSTRRGKEIITLKKLGTLNNLPDIQTSLAKEILRTIGVVTSNGKHPPMNRPNFSNHKALLLYGKSFMAKHPKEIMRYRWQALSVDPGSLFVTLRILEFYAYGPQNYRDIVAEHRLPRLAAEASTHFPGDSHIGVLKGLLLIKQYQYRKAENQLKSVVDRDPNSVVAHKALSNVRMLRFDSDSAVRSASRSVSLWPTSSACHSMLASAYATGAYRIHLGRPAGELPITRRRILQQYARLALREAQVAIKLNPRNTTAWYNILTIMGDLGRQEEEKAAFRHIIQLDPKFWKAYQRYASSLAKRDSKSVKELRQLLSIADKSYGKESGESYLLRGWIAYTRPDRAKRADEILKLLEKANCESEDLKSLALWLKAVVLMGKGQVREFLDIARLGFEKWQSPEWRLLMAKAYEFDWYGRRNNDILEKAVALLEVHVSEVPLDPRGHEELGWCLARLGRLDDAKREYFTVLKLDPGNTNATRTLEQLMLPKSPIGPFGF
ncbi:MAG: hypothetical protein QME62_09825 [Armatimonadota bacterium]|nr:hypothetical protein [Armatimonadota bacterium]